MLYHFESTLQVTSSKHRHSVGTGLVSSTIVLDFIKNAWLKRRGRSLYISISPGCLARIRTRVAIVLEVKRYQLKRLGKQLLNGLVYMTESRVECVRESSEKRSGI